MAFDEMREEEMCVLVAPDGSIQVTTLAPDLPTSFAMSKLLHKAGFGKPPEDMLKEGYRIYPVKVTITKNGDENTAFRKAITKQK